MASQIHEEINKYLSANVGANFECLESALIGAVLNSSKKYKVKNEIINKVITLESSDRENAYKWITENIDKPSIAHVLILYEVCVSPENRKFDGAYFTPDSIVDAIVDLTVRNQVGSICDPACGSGAFLLGSLKKLLQNKAGSIDEVLSKYIWGIDINFQNVEHSKRILSLYAILEGVDKKHFDIGIFQGNSLDFSWENTPRKKAAFDFIVGNPPYVRGRNLTSSLKSQIKSWSSAKGGIADLYVPFFEIGLTWASDKGRLGYITPNTYFSSINGRGVRKMIAGKKILEKIIDFDGFPAFEGLLTYTCVTILDKSGVSEPLTGIADSVNQLQDIRRIKLSKIKYSELENNDWYIGPPDITSSLRMMERVGTPLDTYVPKFTTGVATLRNDLYIFDVPIKNGFLVIQRDGKSFKIEADATVPIIKPNKIKTEEQLKNNSERILYPYRFVSGRKRPELIPEAEFSKSFPGAYSYLLHYRADLEKRSMDKGSAWYAFGRSQALDGFGKKIIFPMMSDRPVFLHVTDPNTLIYCGYALYSDSDEKTQILLKILNSAVFWNYLASTSKNYANGYKSLAKNYVKKFSIPEFSNAEIKQLMAISGNDLEYFLKEKYSNSIVSPQIRQAALQLFS